MAAVRSIGDYELLEELGAGGMGRVYRARHAKTGALRALKVMTLAPEEEAVLRFEREKEILARVGGRGVVPIHDSGMERGQLWFSMALVTGGSLAGKLKKGGKLPWQDAVKLVREVALVLARCHAAGVVHRDVKPDNVLLDDDGGPWLADFGCVRATGAQQLTVTGELIGTISYMSPEQLRGDKVDGLTDVYALATVLHELVSGDRLYPQRTPVEQLIARRNRPASLAPYGAPPELDLVLQSALAFEPDQRTETARRFAAELDAVEKGARPDTAATRRTRRGVVLALGLLVLGAAAVGGGWAASRFRHDRGGEAKTTGSKTLVQKAEDDFKAGRFAEAAAAYTEALALEPRREDLIFGRARAEARAGDEGRAIADFAGLWPRFKGRDPTADAEFAGMLFRRALEENTGAVTTALATALAIEKPSPELGARLADQLWEQVFLLLGRFDLGDPGARRTENRELARRTGDLCRRAWECDSRRLPKWYCSRLADARGLVESGLFEPDSLEVTFLGWGESPLARAVRALSETKMAVKASEAKDRERYFAAARADLEAAVADLPPLRDDECPELPDFAAHMAELGEGLYAAGGPNIAGLAALTARSADRARSGIAFDALAGIEERRGNNEAARWLLVAALLLPPGTKPEDLRDHVARRRLQMLMDEGRFGAMLADKEDLPVLSADGQKYFKAQALIRLARFEEVLEVIPFAPGDANNPEAINAQLLRMQALVYLGRGDEARRLLEETREKYPRFYEQIGRMFPK